MAMDDEFLALIQPVPEGGCRCLFDPGQSASVFRDVEECRGRPSVVNIADPSDEEVSDTESEEVRPRQRRGIQVQIARGTATHVQQRTSRGSWLAVQSQKAVKSLQLSAVRGGLQSMCL